MKDVTFLIVDGERKGMLAYRGEDDCESVLCTRLYDPDTRTFTRTCVGWHCAVCHKPSSYQGHPDCIDKVEAAS